MAKLITNLEKVRVKGGIDKLNEPIYSMDKAIEKMYNDSVELAEIIKNHFEGNKGNQYVVIVTNAKDLAKALEDASISINNMQHQIIQFQEATNCFNDERTSVGSVRKRSTITINPNVVSQFRFFTTDTIKLVQRKLVEFSSKTKETLKRLISEKDALKSIWCDPQYDHFSKFIDEMSQEINKHLRVFDNYADYLQKKITEYLRRTNEIR